MHARTNACTRTTHANSSRLTGGSDGTVWMGGLWFHHFLVVHRPSQGCLAVLCTARASAILQHANTHIILIVHIPQLCLACIDKHSEKINPCVEVFILPNCFSIYKYNNFLVCSWALQKCVCMSQCAHVWLCVVSVRIELYGQVCVEKDRRGSRMLLPILHILFVKPDTVCLYRVYQ